jgi:NAD(P)-dependent dehydrogenase (short-subunit alcohol dehydrogenase family)
MTQKTCFITGANSGIGKQAAIQLAQAGFQVFIGARSFERGQTALLEIKEKSGSTAVELIKIDLSSKQSIIEAAAILNKQLSQLDVLIHNAADFNIAQKETLQSVDGIETIWATNHIGPIILTNGLMELLKKSSQGRILTIASKGLVMHSKMKIDLIDPEFKHRNFSVPKAYYQSKLAQVMYTYWLAEELKDTEITVNCIRVTNVKIDIKKYPNISGFMKFLYKFKSKFSIAPEQMARTYTYLATSNDVATTTGTYFSEKNVEVASSGYSKDKTNIEQVMKLSMKYIN